MKNKINLMEKNKMETKTLTRFEKINLSTTEIAKRIREQLKEEFKNCKFSVTTEYYSMGSSISIYLMKSDRKVIRDFKDISEVAFLGLNRYTKEEVENLQKTKHHQLNQFQLKEEFDVNSWCNGVFLTEEGHNLLKRVVEIVDQYNFDESDSQTDYYCVNFSFHISIGKWNKELEDGGGQ